MLSKLFRKLFLVREIVSQKGEVHFKRYRLIQTPWFAVYVHNILKSDEDKDPHNHPWNFTSLILKGGYIESLYRRGEIGRFESYMKSYQFGSIINRDACQFHQIKLLAPTWTLVFVGKRNKSKWGYMLADGSIKDFDTYRKDKNKG